MNDEAEMTTRKKNRDVGEWSKTTTHVQASSRPVGGGDPLFVFFAPAENETAGSRIEIYKDSAWPVRMQLSMCMYKQESMRRCVCVCAVMHTNDNRDVQCATSEWDGMHQHWPLRLATS